MYRLFAPKPVLADFVDCFWESNFQTLAAATTYHELYVAQYNPNVIFNLSKTYQRDACEVNHSAAVTVNTQAIEFEHTAENNLFGIRFKVGALRLFSPVAMHELADDAPTVADLFGDRWQELENKIQNCTTTAERIAHTEGYLLRQLDDKKIEKYRLAQHIQQHIAAHCRTANSIALLPQHAFLTQRTIDRYFQEYLGISPKKMSRLVRFEQLFATLHRPNFEAASLDFYAFGYHDQAHFSKEFKEFSGFSPKHYLNSFHFVQNLQDNHF